MSVTHCYVGKRRCCGRVFFVSVDDGKPSEGVAEVIRGGDIIERMTMEEFRTLPFFGRCEHMNPPRTPGVR